MTDKLFNVNNVKLAHDGDIDALKNIWSVCFDDNPLNIDIFFNDRFTFADCYVYNKNSVPVAMAFILPSSLHLDGELFSVGYIYACATLPDHRSGGIMSGLISAAMERTSQKYDAFALVPAQHSLFDYYAKLGFRRFFQSHTSVYSRPMGCKNAACITQCDETRFAFIMNECLSTLNVCMQWDKRHIDNALKSARVFEAEIVEFAHDGEYGCGICYVRDGKAELTELFCDLDMVELCVNAVFERYGVNSVTVRLPFSNPNINYNTADEDRGMLYNMRIPEGKLSGRCGYLPLAMD